MSLARVSGSATTLRGVNGAATVVRHARRNMTRLVTVLVPVTGMVAVAICGLIVFGLVTVRAGALPVIVGVIAAVVPVSIVTAALLWVDRWEPEPAKYLLLTFLWGACVATLLALLVNDTAKSVGDYLLGFEGGNRIATVISAPLVEEAIKAVPLVAVLWHRRSEFNGVVDGIVYAGFSAAGFAFTENVYYFASAFNEAGFGDGMSSGVLAAFTLRGVMSPFAHPLFSVVIGIGVALTVQKRYYGAARFILPVVSYIGAVCLHALWNAAATLGGAHTFLNVYFLIMAPLFIGVGLIVVWQRRREQRVVAGALPAMARRGWIAQSEIDLLADLAARRRWRKQARRESGSEAARAVGDYQAAVTELAFLRRRGVTTDDERARHDDLLAEARQTRADAVSLARTG
ncbi:Membrane proteinase PrsW, cleaves anti-sigma factor RsiW, M82 family [Prauserella aidingensis]|nr:Membrane proteinase PrsW, cleaves anti-sigma factor RsiW, M82 family [Prauserella aidingensis]